MLLSPLLSFPLLSLSSVSKQAFFHAYTSLISVHYLVFQGFTGFVGIDGFNGPTVS